ncbi:uncharacterized protein LOC127575596 [Pristis pectinata]|uniref:uncharacterized protein LOC127575596 n=1 Tax=Pristis pectinata TaxID=685728 RepID=UPI00223E5A56|nr:uncharacterized protein LOC127575596 [Pristis pectinata]
MVSHGILGSLLFTIFVIGKCSAVTSEFTNFLNGISNAQSLTPEQKLNIQNLRTDTNGQVHLYPDCKALNRFGNKPSGMYVIKPKNNSPVLVYCDMKTEDGGWILVQKVKKGNNLPFPTTWKQYENTFGDFNNNYWLGNIYLHQLTQEQRYDVKFVLQGGNETVNIDFDSFNIDGEDNNYALRLGAPLNDSDHHKQLLKNDNMMFSTEDMDNDRDSTKNCAKLYGGGWWFNDCTSVMFNSQHIVWMLIMNFQKQLLAFTVMILSAQSFTDAAATLMTYEGLKLKVANAAMVPQQKVNDIVNVKDLLLRKAKYAKDCNELLRQGFTTNGLYVIKPESTQKTPLIVVNCVMNYDCGGWTVLEHKSKQSELTWNETWTTYKYGFGNVLGDHYLGNEYIYFLTNQMWYKAKVLLGQADKNGELKWKHAEYDIFRVGSEMTNYTLHLGAFSGKIPDALSVPENMVDNCPFSTRDRDSDSDSVNCAQKYGGGWWFNTCPSATPFAMLTQKESIYWEPYCKDCTSVTFMVRSVNMHCYKRDMLSRI